ncbi:hypothetical protein V8C86DRAFT_3036561, partial [Haematococcus lacustris]
MERKDVMTWFRRAQGVDPPPGSFRATHFMIGVDWMTMGKNGTWSVGVILLRLLDVPAEEYVLIYDVRMKFTHEQIMNRGGPPSSMGGLKGNLGCFMYGLLKHQLEWFMSADGLHIDVRREIVKRGAAIQSPSDLVRDLGDLANRNVSHNHVVQYVMIISQLNNKDDDNARCSHDTLNGVAMLKSPCSGWRMEDYKHWFVNFSPIVLRGNLLPEPYRSENSATPEGWKQACTSEDLWQPGWSAAAVILCFQQRMATTRTSCLCLLTSLPNLHTTACRLLMQECNVGRTIPVGELWIERDLHDLKSITTSGIPGAQLDAHIAMRVAGHNAIKRLLDRAEPEAQQDYKARLKDELTQTGSRPYCWERGSAECPLQNTRRADCNDTIVFSSVYKRPSTRNNTWVSIRFRLDDDNNWPGCPRATAGSRAGAAAGAGAPAASSAATPTAPPRFIWGRDGLVMIIAVGVTQVLVSPGSHVQVLKVEKKHKGEISARVLKTAMKAMPKMQVYRVTLQP